MSVKLFSFLVILMLAVPAFSYSKEKKQNAGLTTPATADNELYKILKKDISEERYSTKITELTADFSPEQKNQLYEDYKKEPAAPFLLNAFTGLGIGSLSQRDYEGFLYEFGFVAYGASSIIKTAINRDFFGYSNDFSYASGIFNMFLGAGFCAAGYIIGLVRPWTYSKKYNRELTSCLFPEPESPLSFAPVADLQAQNYGLICKINL